MLSLSSPCLSTLFFSESRSGSHENLSRRLYWRAQVVTNMPFCALQPSQGDDKVVSKTLERKYPHGRQRAYVDKEVSHLIRAHRNKLCSYGGYKTDCQYVRVTRTKKEGQKEWVPKEKPLALTVNPDGEGRYFLRCYVPSGPCKGHQYWARLVVWHWHRPPRMSWKQFVQKKLEANHLNLDPAVTLVDQLAICTGPENIEHYLKSDKFLRVIKRPAGNRRPVRKRPAGSR